MLEGEAVLLNVTTGMYYSLNSTATDVWSQLDRGAVIEDLASHLSEVFEVSRSEAEADVSALLEDLVAKQLAVIES